MKNKKELNKVLESNIIIPVYWNSNIDNYRIYIDEDSIREEFEQKLKEIINVIENY